MSRLSILLLCTLWWLPACAGGPAVPVNAEPEGERAWRSISAALAADGDQIDYDTLLRVYQEMVSAPVPIPRVEELLQEMISQRNADPRIDQMVLILAASAIGSSRFAVPNVESLFERILAQDEERISYWVLAFLAVAIGNYPIDLPSGDALVDRVEEWQARLDAGAADGKESFGSHFLPPPKSRTIVDYLAGLDDLKARQWERNAYYRLLAAGIPEDRIAAAFDRLIKGGEFKSGDKPRLPLSWLAANWHLLPEETRGR